MLGVRPAGPVNDPTVVPSPVPVSPDGHGSGGADPYAAERDAWTVLTAVDGLGPIAFAALLAAFGNGRSILLAAAEPGAIRRLTATPAAEPSGTVQHRRPVSDSLAAAIASAVQEGPHVLERTRALGLVVVTVEESGYPRRLLEIAMPPHVLFVRGSVAALQHERTAAVVGTRRPTTYGRTIAGRIATALAAADAMVVSGLAYGIDGTAHDATIRAGGTTVAVIGGGHAAGIPAGHRRLAEMILERGGAIVSELGPDVVPTHGTFPRRNRIISGLAKATIVVEAPARSGALVTASWALEQGRECFLVPGPLDSTTSSGCHAFLREFHDNARIVAGIPQLIADLGFSTPLVRTHDGPPDALVGAALVGLGRATAAVALAIVEGMASVDELVAVTDLPVAAVLASLAILEGRGLVAAAHGRYRPAGALLGERPRPLPR
jgi:DNA processing protein